ncbi:MAG: hypothetical protein KJP00_16250 [Bacteroidia bacterium]|nr:hypothetical protein [Bacteroidia bacterium]
MELTKQQIQHLFTFVRSKYIRYYDVQLELVDHLASAIEEEMSQESGLTFEQALNRVYSRFPITGFNEFLQEKTKALNKYWRRRFWSYMKQYFTPPKIILTLLFSFFFFYTSNVQFHFFGNEVNLLWVVFIAIALGGLFVVGKYFPINPNKSRLLSKIIFIQQLSYYILGPVYFIGYVWPQFLVNHVNINNMVFNFIMSFVCALTLIALSGAMTDFRVWMQEEIEERYKEFRVEF